MSAGTWSLQDCVYSITAREKIKIQSMFLLSMNPSDSIITNHCKPDRLDFMLLKLQKFYIEKTIIFTKIDLAISPQEDKSCLPCSPLLLLHNLWGLNHFKYQWLSNFSLCFSTNRDPSCLSVRSSETPVLFLWFPTGLLVGRTELCRPSSWSRLPSSSNVFPGHFWFCSLLLKPVLTLPVWGLQGLPLYNLFLS